MSEKDYNFLDKWLPKKLDERRLSVEDLAREARLARTVIYMWMRDEARPSTNSVQKVLKVLNARPVWRQGSRGLEAKIEQVTFEEMVSQFVVKKAGRPVGYSPGTKSVTVRQR